MKKIILALFGFFWMSTSVFAIDRYRMETTVGGQFANDWFMSFQERVEFRQSDGTDGLGYHHSDVGVGYNFHPKSIFDGFKVGLNYRHIYEYNNTDWAVEYRPYAWFEPSWDMPLDLVFSVKNELEFRDGETEETWRYRIRPKVQHTPTGLYVSSKLSHNLNSTNAAKSGELDSNDFEAGIERDVINNFSGKAFYRYQHTYTQAAGWEPGYDMIGVGVQYTW